MKILTRTAAAVLAAVTAAAVWSVPAAAAASVQGISSTSCIADNANILSRDTETYITNISVALQENCSGAQIGVYTTDYVGNNTMEGYAYEVFQAWGLGSADQDNGMVLLMATGDDNYWATPGEGLESAFSGNVLSDLLYDNLEASWAKQDYDTGARKTVLAMAERICDVYGVSLDMDAIGSGLADSSGRIVENTQSRSNGGAVLTLILLTIIIAVIVIAILKTPRGPRGPQGPTYTGGRRGPNVFFFGGPVYWPRRPRRPPPPPPPGGGFGARGSLYYVGAYLFAGQSQGHEYRIAVYPAYALPLRTQSIYGKFYIVVFFYRNFTHHLSFTFSSPSISFIMAIKAGDGLMDMPLSACMAFFVAASTSITVTLPG